ncbi:hypothetical protein [Psychroserpens sp.]|uniref:hypothetical protein n=1 Tax=Psychroserpens sp. TaxID=2020870 RepID=UPI001B286940|nr:hypothetical protein [Psychroserpens sp.]MBO6607359.1 hypothetical protein [Psychroserpens sp.]MBO6654565.1 hypothetical protein [Psychroserpens sp.]MBO6681088.1 hypothetical protein [Psychroserpens sp.]MBO6749957.1 hypothetical protein [Psychroserpens sp.]MBO6916057.1 hypothetical protein [Psychroserpens sp.]
MFSSTDIEKELRALKGRTSSQKDFVDALLADIAQNASREEEIKNTLSESNGGSTNDFNIDLLESDRIYHIDMIKSICIDFRLRFLDSKYFKNEFPEEALDKIKDLENAHHTKLEGFKVMAPSKLFRLENPDDPLLFAPIGNGYYYLIHKWGNDLHPLRKWLVKPVKNLDNLMITALIVSFVISYVFNSFLTLQDDNFISNFFLIFLFNFKCIIAVIMFYAIPRGKSVNDVIWDSKYSR